MKGKIVPVPKYHSMKTHSLFNEALRHECLLGNGGIVHAS